MIFAFARITIIGIVLLLSTKIDHSVKDYTGWSAYLSSYRLEVSYGQRKDGGKMITIDIIINGAATTLLIEKI